MTTKKRTRRTLARWIQTLGACNGSGRKYAGLTLEQAWRKAAAEDEQAWVVEAALGVAHISGSQHECWCDKPKGRFKKRVFAKFRQWQRHSVSSR